MAEKNVGVRSLLMSPSIYSFTQRLLGGEKSRKVFVAEYVRPRTGDRILDIGCGPGDILEYLPDVDYVGFDANPRYIDRAVGRFQDRGKFQCQRVSEETLEGLPPFNIVLACAILHHLDNEEANHLFAIVKSSLRAGGRLITLDCCYMPGQSLLSKFFIGLDRGQNIRSAMEYRALAERHFSNVSVHVRTDMLWIPYTHIIMDVHE